MAKPTLEKMFANFSDNQLEELRELVGQTVTGGSSSPYFADILAEQERRAKARTQAYDVQVRLRIVATDSATAMQIARTYCNRAESYSVAETRAVEYATIESATFLDPND